MRIARTSHLERSRSVSCRWTAADSADWASSARSYNRSSTNCSGPGAEEVVLAWAERSASESCAASASVQAASAALSPWSF